MARRMSDVQAREELDQVAYHGLPIQVEAEVVRQVDSWSVERSVGLSEYIFAKDTTWGRLI